MRRIVVAVVLLMALVVPLGVGNVYAASRPTRGIHVYLMDMRGIDDDAPYRVKAVVYVRSEYNKGVANAYVTAALNAPGSLVEYSTHRTNTRGQASWILESSWPGVWMFCVTGISKPGYEYQWWKNNDLCDAIYFP